MSPPCRGQALPVFAGSWLLLHSQPGLLRPKPASPWLRVPVPCNLGVWFFFWRALPQWRQRARAQAAKWWGGGEERQGHLRKVGRARMRIVRLRWLSPVCIACRPSLCRRPPAAGCLSFCLSVPVELAQERTTQEQRGRDKERDAGERWLRTLAGNGFLPLAVCLLWLIAAGSEEGTGTGTGRGRGTTAAEEKERSGRECRRKGRERIETMMRELRAHSLLGCARSFPVLRSSRRRLLPSATAVASRPRL
jgi:hypothetical protein